MKKSLLLILGFALLSLTSCEYKYIDPLEVTITETVSFSQQIEPIFQSDCNTCHSSTSPILTSGNAYNSLINGNFVNTDSPETSILYTQTNGDVSGHFTLSPTESALILKWIQDGAKNN